MDMIDMIKWWVSHTATEHEIDELKQIIKLTEGEKHK